MSKLTKEQVKFFIETMTDDMHNTTQHEIAETLLSKFDECELLQTKLLAYKQAGKETKIYQYQSCLFNDENGEKDWYWDDCDKGFFEQYDPAHRRIVYTAPVLPKQTEPVDLSQQEEILNRILNWILKELPVPTQKASAMAIRLSSVIGIISDLEVSAPAKESE
ncbi:hypothetical protein XK97_01125 [Obesumbacterium proteus]|uniref:hypothetical protein n=1 Tax=Obesumbacterium proteus TaxID=82983 RepID=UPI000621F64E|nr:hypothetical protein [Obesumbacterium proteus]KKI49023.1 hypothetical protein XK97_01125 [Obesumbacterium proteus]